MAMRKEKQESTGVATARLELLGYETVRVPAGRFATAKFRLRLNYDDMSGTCGGVFLDELDHLEDLTFWANPDVGIVKSVITSRDKVCARAAGVGCEGGQTRHRAERID